jgi:hypothetical protein
VPAGRPNDDPLALFADHVAAALAAGAPLDLALDFAATGAAGEAGPALTRVNRRARLGQPFSEALLAAGPPGAEDLAAVLGRAARFGLSPRAALTKFAAARRVEVERSFEREVKRAPVLMVLPLVLCVLPAFGLLAVAPFLRGITFG